MRLSTSRIKNNLRLASDLKANPEERVIAMKEALAEMALLENGRPKDRKKYLTLIQKDKNAGLVNLAIKVRTSWRFRSDV